MKNYALQIAAFAAGLLIALSSSANAVMVHGNPYTPAGADFQIIGLQGVDALNPFGKGGFSPQVNTDFEFKGAIGVSYDQGSGHLKDFGIGLFDDPNHLTQSSGLQIKYKQLVDPTTITITLEDFDIHNNAAFNPGKVEPFILFLGANNTVIASADPAKILAALTPSSNPNGNAKDDVWDVNLGVLLNGLHTPISGFILFADTANGEKSNSDPYLLVAVGNGTPVIPEPSNYIAGFAAIGFALLFQAKQLLKRRAKA